MTLREFIDTNGEYFDIKFETVWRVRKDWKLEDMFYYFTETLPEDVLDSEIGTWDIDEDNNFLVVLTKKSVYDPIPIKWIDEYLEECNDAQERKAIYQLVISWKEVCKKC